MSKIRNRKSKNPGHFDLEGLCQPRRLVETSQVFTLPVAHFARIIDFRSYVDATVSLYSMFDIIIWPVGRLVNGLTPHAHMERNTHNGFHCQVECKRPVCPHG